MVEWLFRKTGPVIWDATIGNIQNKGIRDIPIQTPAKDAYDIAKQGYGLILTDNNKPIGVLEFFQISEDDIAKNKPVNQLNYFPAEVKDQGTKVREVYEELEKGKAVLVKGAGDKITGVVTMSDYSRKRFT
jgi:hypothetical protein